MVPLNALTDSSDQVDSACLETFSSIFRTGSTLKCRNAFGLDFTALTHLFFSVDNKIIIAVSVQKQLAHLLQENITELLGYLHAGSLEITLTVPLKVLIFISFFLFAVFLKIK